MYFESFRELMLMDGHGAYVWSVYVFAVLICLTLIVSPLLKKRSITQALRGQIRREKGAANQKSPGLE